MVTQNVVTWWSDKKLTALHVMNTEDKTLELIAEK